MIAALIALFLAALADVVTTYWVVSHPAGREMNPKVARLIARYGLVRGLLASKAQLVPVAMIAAAGLMLVRPALSEATVAAVMSALTLGVWTGTAITGAAAAWNLRNILILRSRR